LLDDIGEAEVQFLEMLNPRVKQESLRPISWEELSSCFYLPMWKNRVERFAHLIADITTDSLPDICQRVVEIGSQIPDPKGKRLNPEERSGRAVELLAMAFGLVLLNLNHGWKLIAQPGQFYMQRGSERLNPLTVVPEVISGNTRRDIWRSRCQDLGISGVHLSDPVETSV
jgi:hypothetical protein